MSNKKSKYGDDRDDDLLIGSIIYGTDRNDALTGTSGEDRMYGGKGNDRISGGAGSDMIDGGAGNDNIDAGAGDDTLIGGAGNDEIDGGAGIDVALYSGNFSDYKLTLSRDGGHQGAEDDDTSAMTVHDIRAGSPDGVDVLKNVEILRFADGEYRNGQFYPANTPAVIGDPTVAVVTEDDAVSAGNLAAIGAISISDANAGEASFRTAVVGAVGNLGTLVLAASGAYTYTVANSAVQYLGAGDTKIESFTITSLDGTSKVVSFTINGTNDAAVIGTPTAVSVTEDVAIDGAGRLTATGAISIADVDADEADFRTAVVGAGGNLGTLVLAANGAYTYAVVNAAVQSLGAGITKVDSFTITSLDGTSKVLSFTINGTNDSAVIGTPTVSSVTEDLNANAAGNLTASGTISIGDVDAGQASFQTSVTGAPTNLGSLVLASGGAYTYTVADSAVQFLAAGISRVDSFTVTSLDGTTKVVTFTINGTNDAAVIGTPTAASVTEDAGIGSNLTATGTISIGDADAGQAGFLSAVGAATNLGSLVLASNGTYTYTVANSAVQHLGAGATKIDSFTVTSLDGTSKVVNFTIHGANDAAVIGTPTVNAVTEDVATGLDGRLSATGTIPLSDADAGQDGFQTSVVAAPGTLGALAIHADGSYTYSVANSAVQYLGAGLSKLESFAVTSLDGSSRTVSFTIHGANDAAVIGDPSFSGVIEGVGVSGAGNLSATGTISISDADAGQAGFQTSVSDDGSNLGTLVLAADGSYTYSVANAAVEFLAAGERREERFTVTSLDGTSKEVTFVIEGVDAGAAIIGYPPASAVTEDVDVVAGMLKASGSISISDPDPGEAFFTGEAFGFPGNLGTLVIDADGNYTYSVANAAVQYLGAGATRTEDFMVSSVDGTIQLASFTIRGVNDAAVIGLPTVSTLTESVDVVAGQLTAAGTISIADDDTAEALFQTLVADDGSNLGNLVLSSDGSYTYSVENSAVEYLAPGETRVESFTIASVDGTTQSVSFTINGASPAVIGTPSVDAVTEDLDVVAGQLMAAGVISIVDSDPGQDSFQTTVGSTPGNLGTLVLASDGSYTYAVDNAAVQYLGEGATRVEDFTLTAVDGTTQTVSFSIHGANDAPVVLDEARTILEDEVVVMTGAGAADSDAGDIVTIVSVSDVAFGTAELVDGVLTFRPDANYDGPASFTYTVADQLGATSTATVSLNITAVADAPIIPVPSNLGFELASFHNWEILGAVGMASFIDTTDGIVTPFDGSERMAVLDSSWVEQGDLERFLGLSNGGLNGLAGDPYTGSYWDYNPAVDTGVYTNVTDGAAMRTSLAVADGQVVSFDYNFISGDARPYGDFAFVVINGAAQRLAGNFDIDNYASTGWQHFEYIVDLDGNPDVQSSGIVSLGFGVVDTGDIDANGRLLVDNVRYDGSAADGYEDTAILLPIASALADTDGSESLSLTTISGVPFGAILSAGTDNLDGTWTLTQADLPNLTITPPADYFGTFTLSVAATSTEASNGSQATTIKTFEVTVFPVSDGTGIDADSQVIVPRDSGEINLNIAAPAGAIGDVLITSVPNNGTVTTAAGLVVTAGSHVTAAELPGLGFTPGGATWNNSGMSYTWTDGSGTHTNTSSFSLANATGAIRVAVMYSFEQLVPDGTSGQIPLSELAAWDIYDQLNDSSYFNFSADIIQLNVTDTAGGLFTLLSDYDVVIHAGARGDVMTDAYWSALRAYVEADAGGVITAGTFAETLHATSLAGNADADFVTPIAPAGDVTVSGLASTFTVVGGHDITYGIGTVPGPGINDTILEGALQIDVNAVSLAAHPAGGTVIAYSDNAGMGRTVYLGEPYTESEVAGVHTEPVRSGYADQLLEQAVHWAAKGSAETRSVTLSGGTGNDVLAGGGDADVLSGNDGNDKLVGAGGSDVLGGGAGSDLFYYNAGDASGGANDAITDFTTGTGGDVLDIHDLLTGYTAGTSAAAEFVQLLDAGGGNTQVNVDVDGGGDSFVSLALLSNVTMTGTLLNDLLVNGNLHLG